MKAGIIVFPGTNREQDMVKAVKTAGGIAEILWHKQTELPVLDVVILAGGFSYGDYLRTGAMAACSPIMSAVKRHADAGRAVLGVCNGFQILCEAGLLPGVLMRNVSRKFICETARLSVENNDTLFTKNYETGQVIDCPVAHGEGNYFADEATLNDLENNNQIVFRYAENTNPNGSQRNIAGIINKQGNVLGMMPHPENLVLNYQGGLDGLPLFKALCG